MDPKSNSVNDLLVNKTLLVTLYIILLTVRATDKIFELQGEFLKIITNKNYNVVLAELSDNQIMYDFSKEICFDQKASGKKSPRNRSPIRLPKSLGIKISASGVSSNQR